MSSPSVVDGDRQLRGRDFSINFTSEKACLSCLHIKSVDAAWNGSLIVIKSFVSALETVFSLLRRYSFKHPKIQSFRSEYLNMLYTRMCIIFCLALNVLIHVLARK